MSTTLVYRSRFDRLDMTLKEFVVIGIRVLLGVIR